METILVALDWHGALMSYWHFEVLTELWRIRSIFSEGKCVVNEKLQVSDVTCLQASPENDAGLRVPVQLVSFWF